MASIMSPVATTTQHCRASQRVVTSQIQARSFTPAVQKPARAAARPVLRLDSRRNVKTYAQNTETAAGALMMPCDMLAAGHGSNLVPPPSHMRHEQARSGLQLAL